jgi:GNAT superfamily N-acetyltransferase
MHSTNLDIRLFQPSDQLSVREIYGMDKSARPQLLHTYPRMSEYLADSMSYYIEHEPQSAVVVEVEGQVVGVLLGAVDTITFERIHGRSVRPMLFWRTLTGSYGWPGWVPPILKTELAGRHLCCPKIDLESFPAHLHIDMLPAWHGRGIGTALMSAYQTYLQASGVPGFHLYASSFHPLGLAFYRKLGLEELGVFEWHFHNGQEWLLVTEMIFGQQLELASLTY